MSGSNCWARHSPGECPLRIEGLLRAGDLVELWPGEVVLLLVSDPRHPLDGPWRGRFYPLDLGDPAFEDSVPSDFAERAVREGRLVGAADAWSAWTECSARPQDDLDRPVVPCLA